MAKSAANAKALAAALVEDERASITERVAVALAGPMLSSAEWQALRLEAVAELAAMSGRERIARDASADLTIPAASARFARDEADDILHEIRRVQAAIDKIDELLPRIRFAEHQDAIRPVYERYRSDRAALIERIRQEWPALSAQMIDLIEAIEAFRQTPAVEIPEGEDPLRIDVEAEARGCDSSFYVPPYPGAGVQSVPRLRDARIPRFTPSSREDERLAWPRYQRTFS